MFLVSDDYIELNNKANGIIDVSNGISINLCQSAQDNKTRGRLWHYHFVARSCHLVEDLFTKKFNKKLDSVYAC